LSGRPNPDAQAPAWALASGRAPDAISSSFNLLASPSQEYVDVNPMKANEYSCFCQTPDSGGAEDDAPTAKIAVDPRTAHTKAQPAIELSFMGIETMGIRTLVLRHFFGRRAGH
jgi:hypothetical protein